MSSFGGLDVNVDDDDNDGIGGIIVNIRKKRRRFQDGSNPSSSHVPLVSRIQGSLAVRASKQVDRFTLFASLISTSVENETVKASSSSRLKSKSYLLPITQLNKIQESASTKMTRYAR